MFLATVTCNRDFHQMLLQAESIQKFVEPCKHVIIINEAEPNTEFWYRWLSPYYENHELEIIPRIEYLYPMQVFGHRNPDGVVISDSNGWRIQQIQKLLLSYVYQDDYVLLDSKSFFVCKTSLSEWDNIVGSGVYNPVGSIGMFEHTLATYQESLGYNISYVTAVTPPYKIKHKPLVDNCKLSELGYHLFRPEFRHAVTSEFIFYSLFVQDEIKKSMDCVFPPLGISLWDFDRTELFNKINNSLTEVATANVKTLAFHRKLLHLLSLDEFSKINDILSSGKFNLHFKNKIIPMINSH